MTTTPRPFDLSEWPDPRSAVVFLDFDGTLVELAETPDGITVPDALPGLLERVADAVGGRLHLVSGRDVSAIARFLPGFGGDIHGGHGAQARIDGEMRRHPMSGGDEVRQAQDRARAFASARDGVTAELKDAGAVLHYRQAPAEGAAVAEFMQAEAAKVPRFEAHGAKMAVELKPQDASKGGVVERVLRDHPDGRPLVLGDDATDEPAMAAANARGGMSVKVGEGESCALQRLDGPAAVHRALAEWIEGKRNV